MAPVPFVALTNGLVEFDLEVRVPASGKLTLNLGRCSRRAMRLQASVTQIAWVEVQCWVMFMHVMNIMISFLKGEFTLCTMYR